MSEEPQAPPDVGSILRQARLRRGQSLEAVFHHTRIPKKFLEAIEANRFDELPGHVYLRGFLKIYCDHLDLDFDPLWNQIAPPKPAPPRPEGGARTGEAEAPPAKEARGTDGGEAAETADLRPKTGPGGGAEEAAETPPAVALGAVLAALAAAAAILWMLQGSRTETPPKPQTPPPPSPIAPVRAAEPMALKITFRRETWVSLRCDGILRFEGRGPAATEQTWPAMSEFTLRTASPDDLILRLDGREIKLDPTLRDASGHYKLGRQ